MLNTFLPARWEIAPLTQSWLSQLETYCQNNIKNPLYTLILRVLKNEPIQKKDLLPLITANNKTIFFQDTDELLGPIQLSHLSALLGNIEFADHLHELDLFEDIPINNGVFPSHLAALRGHLSFLLWMQAKDYQLLFPSKAGYTPIDVFETIYPDRAKHCPFTALPKEISVMRKDKTIERVPLAKAEDEYQFIYTDRICENAATVEAKLLKGPFNENPISPDPMNPSLALARINELCPDLELEMGLGVVATQKISQGTDLGKYSGLFGMINPLSLHVVSGGGRSWITPDGEERTGHLDAEIFHNFIPLAADGFPNVEEYRNKQGGAQHLRALRDIMPGEFILWDYGMHHSVKWDPYIHLAEQEFFGFLAKIATSVQKIKRAEIGDLKSPIKNPELRLLCRQFLYFFSHPRVFLERMLTDKIDISLFDEEFCYRMCFSGLSGIEIIDRMVILVANVFTIVNTAEKRKILWKYLNKIGKTDFKTAYAFCENFQKNLPKVISSMDSKEFETFLTCDV